MSMYSDGFSTFDTVGGVAAPDGALDTDVPTDAEGSQEQAVGANSSDRSLVNRAWLLIVVVGLGGLWLLGAMFRGHLQG